VPSAGPDGFLYDNGTFTTLAPPGGINSTAFSFLAIPKGGEAAFATFAKLLSAHARHGGGSDFLPRMPGIPGESPHSTKTSGMMDHTFAAGGRFAPFGGLASDHAATQVFLHGNGTSEFSSALRPRSFQLLRNRSLNSIARNPTMTNCVALGDNVSCVSW
jgi:hypothetical protein